MTSSKRNLVVAAKLVLAAVLFSALVGYIGSGTAGPRMEWSKVLPLLLIVALVVFAVVLPSVVISLTMGQWALHHGGTDAQWFWFPSEPKGLVRQREEQAAMERATDRSVHPG
jgi:Zn-dependent protease with chaperone function